MLYEIKNEFGISVEMASNLHAVTQYATERQRHGGDSYIYAYNSDGKKYLFQHMGKVKTFAAQSDAFCLEKRVRWII